MPPALRCGHATSPRSPGSRHGAPLPALAAEVVVQPGDTLSDIAARHGVSVTRLMQVNGIRDADQVEPDAASRFPGAAAAAVAAAAGQQA